MAAVEHADNLSVREDFFEKISVIVFSGCLTRTPADFLTVKQRNFLYAQCYLLLIHAACLLVVIVFVINPIRRQVILKFII